MQILKRKSEQEIRECADAQAKYCDEKKYPDFAPRYGVCWNCRRNIYQNHGWKIEKGNRQEISNDGVEVDHITGISLERATSELVTGCPHCNRSYCD